MRTADRQEQFKAAFQARKAKAREYKYFFDAWRKNPKAVGALLPSSPALARAITRHLQPGDGPVLELGVGTGVFTRAMLARGVRQEDLILVERDPAMAAALARAFPLAHIVTDDASRLGRPGHADSGPIPPLSAAVCGLPLLNMCAAAQLRIVRSVFAALLPGRALYLFTYGWRCPVRGSVLERLGVEAERLETVMANVPPAHVWRLRLAQ
ncbi:hypothetical protein AAV94_00270 [Lampropedia cohaerens]|uniref:Methyltransferase domain-containing protein n=1 Tax=Lampropedia cohaerens TaxID=1610491 RepID=A0A0U1Q3N1_9BURK|nr:hypothetical protein [Lampropedia cohaerens]KKW69356.1 hypothetical protein AAV94_00270 [Lampropedia cohaerens]